jgi:hypothetical protein
MRHNVEYVCLSVSGEVNNYTIYDSRAGRPPQSVSARLRVCYIVRTDRYN